MSRPTPSSTTARSSSSSGRSSSSSARSTSCSSSRAGSVDFADEIRRLEKKARKLQEEIFAELTPWQKVQLSRHPGAALHARLHAPPVRRLRRAARRPRASATTRRSSAAWRASTGARCWSSATRRAATPRRTCAATSACRGPRATARRARLMELAARFGRPILTLHRHARRLPRHRRRGARPGRGHRQEPARSWPACRCRSSRR